MDKFTIREILSFVIWLNLALIGLNSFILLTIVKKTDIIANGLNVIARTLSGIIRGKHD